MTSLLTSEETTLGWEKEEVLPELTEGHREIVEKPVPGAGEGQWQRYREGGHPAWNPGTRCTSRQGGQAPCPHLTRTWIFFLKLLQTQEEYSQCWAFLGHGGSNAGLSSSQWNIRIWHHMEQMRSSWVLPNVQIHGQKKWLLPLATKFWGSLLCSNKQLKESPNPTPSLTASTLATRIMTPCFSS